MTLSDAVQNTVQGWTIDKSIPIFTVSSILLTGLSGLIAVVMWGNGVSNDIGNVKKDQGRLEREQDRQGHLMAGFPERFIRLEAKMDVASEKVDQANQIHMKTLSDIKELLEIRAYVPPVPKRAAVVRRPVPAATQ